MKKLILVVALILVGCGDSATKLKNFKDSHPEFVQDVDTGTFVRETKIATLSDGCILSEVEYSSPSFMYINSLRMIRCPKSTVSTRYQAGKQERTISVDN